VWDEIGQENQGKWKELRAKQLNQLTSSIEG